MNYPVNDRSGLLSALALHNKRIRSFGVKSLGIFGSFCSDTVNKDSNIDLLVEFESGEKTFDKLWNCLFTWKNY